MTKLKFKLFPRFQDKGKYWLLQCNPWLKTWVFVLRFWIAGLIYLEWVSNYRAEVLQSYMKANSEKKEYIHTQKQRSKKLHRILPSFHIRIRQGNLNIYLDIELRRGRTQKNKVQIMRIIIKEAKKIFVNFVSQKRIIKT